MEQATEQKRAALKWIGAGCAGLVLVSGCLILSCGGLAAVLYGVVSSQIKKTDAYQEALAVARRHPAVIDAIGTPIEEGFLVRGKFSVSNGSGSAEISIPVSGPKGRGKVHVSGVKERGTWRYTELVFESHHGEWVDLRDPHGDSG